VAARPREISRQLAKPSASSSGFEAASAKPNQGTANRQTAEIVGQTENSSTGRGDYQQTGFDAARAETVEQHAERQLGGAKGEEIGARQQTERIVAEMQFAGEDRADDRIGRAVQVGEEVAGREGQKQPDPLAAGIGCAHADPAGGDACSFWRSQAIR